MNIMEFTVTQPAAQWYKRELELEDGDYVRFFARYGGYSDIHRGFSLAISMEKPNDPAFQTESAGITFYVEKNDAWYFHDVNFRVKYRRKEDDVVFDFDEKKPS